MRRAGIAACFLPICCLEAQAAATGQDAAEFFRRGAAWFSQKRPADAVEALSRSLELNPNQPKAAKLLGLSYQILERHSEAEQAFTRACTLAPDDAEAWFFLGRLEYVRNFFDKAREALRKSVALNGRDFRAHEALALALEADSQMDDAIASYREAVRWNGAHAAPSPSPHLNYGMLLYKLGKLEESAVQLRRAQELNPRDWQPPYELAKVRFRRQQFAAAVDDLRAALDNRPPAADAARVYYLLSQVYAQLGREGDARAALEACRKLQR